MPTLQNWGSEKFSYYLQCHRTIGEQNPDRNLGGSLGGALLLTTVLCLLLFEGSRTRGTCGPSKGTVMHELAGARGSQMGCGLRGLQNGVWGGVWTLGDRGPKSVRGALLPSTLTRKTRLSWGASHRYSPASLLRAPRTRSTCLAPACSSCTRPWLTSRSPSLYQRTAAPGPERCTTSSRSPPGVLRTLVWATSGATTRTGDSVGAEPGVTGRKRLEG